jgi:hypothetical protein
MILISVLAMAGTVLAVTFGGSDRRPSLVVIKQADRKSLATSSLARRFAILNVRHTNKCGLQPKSLDSISTAGRLQGSCCFPMTYAKYAQQVRGLRTYRQTPEIPVDPYDVSVELAKQLTSYASDIALTASQQATYDSAVRLSREHGPCCCRCWRWTAFEGQAKKFIVERRFSAAKIAAIWGLEDGCGGKATNV